MSRKSGVFEPMTSLVLVMLMIPMLAHTGSGESAKAGPASPSEILAKVKAATGGDAWDNLKTRHTVVTFKTSGLEGKVEGWEDLQTGHGLIRFALGPMTGAQGWDGTTIWSQDPSGQPKPEEGEDAVLGQMNEAYLRTLGYWYPDRWPATIVLRGEETDHGRRFYLVDITPEKGRLLTVWIDAKTWTFDRSVEQTAMETRTSYFSDYRESNGVRVPFAIRVTNGETKYDQYFTVEQVEWNVSIAPGQFAMPAPPAADYRFAEGKTQTTVPFQLINNHIYVDVKLNGKGPYRMLCDTGGQNVVTPTLVKELGLQSQGALQGRGVGEKSEDVGLTTVDALTVGDATLDKQVFAVFPLEPFSNVEGIPQNGLIGYEVFKRFVVAVDYEQSRLTLTEPSTFTYTGTGTIVRFKFEQSMPQVQGSIDGIPGTFSIDTGSRVSLSLMAPFAEKNGLKQRPGPHVQAVVGWGVGGPSRSMVTRMQELRLGDVSVHGVVTDMSMQSRGATTSPYLAGNVGAGVLKRFNLIFEYGKQEIIFEPNRHHEEPDVYDRSGMWINADGKTFVIVDVTAGGAAEAAGLKAGDRILSVDGRPAEAVGLVGLRTRFRSDAAGTSIRIQAEQGGKKRDVTLVLRDLV